MVETHSKDLMKITWELVAEISSKPTRNPALKDRAYKCLKGITIGGIAKFTSSYLDGVFLCTYMKKT